MNNPILIQGDTTYKKSKNVKYHRRCNNCGKEYTGWGKYFCRKKCRQMAKGEKSLSWKGNNVTRATGHQRALKMFKLEPCEICKSKKSERHHIDGNPINNKRKNIMFLCRKHHLLIDGRLKRMWLARHLPSTSPNP